MTTLSRGAAVCAAVILAVGGISGAVARPVSYPDAWTLQIFNEARRHAALAHYTFTPKTALGLRIEDRLYAEHTFFGVQANHLIRRWNAPGSQANIYLKTALGAADGEFNTGEGSTRAAGLARIDADWENRRVFVSAGYGGYAVEGQAFRELTGRLGIAPYVADFGSLHTWAMVQIDHRPDALEAQGAETLTITPLLRFFKGPALLEVGYSTNDEALLNFTYRF
ncbi:MAG: hypothetical protein AAGI89_07115 [Pseudomonadota bacterium]